MSNLQNDIQTLDQLIRDLEKINSKLENGHIVHAWRDNRRVISGLEMMKSKALENAKSEKDVDALLGKNEK